MNNTGAYVTLPQLLARLYPSIIVSEKAYISLSNKGLVTPTFDYTSDLSPLQRDDIIVQGDKYATVVSITSPNHMTLDTVEGLSNGAAVVFRASFTKEELLGYCKRAMQLIDSYTGQWFNAREFVGENAIRIEGDNSPLMVLPVPIISVSSLKVNNAETALPNTDYMVFNGRAIPDDRQNPRIKLQPRVGADYIFRETNPAYFMRGKFNYIEGVFGFLEPDGTTPEGIQWATARLTMLLIQKEAATVVDGGSSAIKREKVDLHETEYAVGDPVATHKIAPYSGDQDVDRIIKQYKSPGAIGGTIPTAYESKLMGFWYDTSPCGTVTW